MSGIDWKYWITNSWVMGWVQWIGLFLTILGFWGAIAQIRKTRSATEAASAAVREALEELRNREAIANIAAAIGLAEQLMMLLRNRTFSQAFAYIDQLRRHLGGLRRNADIPVEFRESLNKYLNQLGLLTERIMDIGASVNQSGTETEKDGKLDFEGAAIAFVTEIAKMIDDLNDVLVSIRQPKGSQGRGT